MTEPKLGHQAIPVNLQVALMRLEQPPLHFYRYLQYRVGSHYHWVYRLRMDDKSLSSIIHDGRTRIDALYLDGAPAGFFELFQENETTVDLAYFGLMAQAQGLGLGRWFLQQAVDAAWSLAPLRVTVNTCTLDHPGALPLYQKFGFVPVHQTETMIEPLTDADLLRLAQSD